MRDNGYRNALGVDPGETTGLCCVTFFTAAGEAKLVWADQMPWDAAADVVQYRCRTWASDVACERYVVNAKTATKGQAAVESAIGMVGVCRRYAGMYGAELVLETASSAKKLVSDEVLRRLALWTPGRPHANDAARQAVLLGVKRRWLTASDLAGRR